MSTDLRDAVAAAIVSHEWTDFPRSAHNQHNYYAECAVCQRDVPRITEIALAVLLEDPGDLPDRMSDAIDDAIISGDDYNPVKAANAALSVRDELVAHLSARVAKAEARVGHAEAGAQLSSERLAKVRQELAEAKRERDRLRLAWQSARERAKAYGESIERLCEEREWCVKWYEQAEGNVEAWTNTANGWQARAEDAEATVERVKAQHRQGDPEDPMCRHCRMTWPCPTVRVLDVPQPTETTTTPARETA